MKLKSHYTTAIVVAYILIFIGFTVFKKSRIFGFFGSFDDRNCSYPCINFCKASSEKFSDDKLEISYKNISNYNSKFFASRYGPSWARRDVSVNRVNLVCGTFRVKVVVDDLKDVEVYAVSYQSTLR